MYRQRQHAAPLQTEWRQPALTELQSRPWAGNFGALGLDMKSTQNNFTHTLTGVECVVPDKLCPAAPCILLTLQDAR